MRDDVDDVAGGDLVEFKTAKAIVRNEQIRREAGLAYISDPQCDSLDKLAQHPKFMGRVSLRTLERWCTADNWVIERQRFLTETFKEMRRRAADTLTQALVADVQMLIDVRERAYQHLMDPEGVQPRSYEGMLRGFVDVSRRVEEIARESADRLVPGGMAPEDDGHHDALPDGMSPEELDAMTKAALEHRRAELEALVEVDERELLGARSPSPTVINVASSADAGSGESGT